MTAFDLIFRRFWELVSVAQCLETGVILLQRFAVVDGVVDNLSGHFGASTKFTEEAGVRMRTFSLHIDWIEMLRLLFVFLQYLVNCFLRSSWLWWLFHLTSCFHCLWRFPKCLQMHVMEISRRFLQKIVISLMNDFQLIYFCTYIFLVVHFNVAV